MKTTKIKGWVKSDCKKQDEKNGRKKLFDWYCCKIRKTKNIMRLEKGHEVLEPLPQDHNPLPESLPGSQVSPYRMAEKKSSEIRKIL